MTESTRVSIRLDEHTRREVQNLVAEEKRSKSAVLRDLLQEAVRMRRCPGIVFVRGPTGRRPVIAGSGLEVWELVSTYRACGEDYGKLSEVYDWLTPFQLRSALAYWQLYPEDIAEEIERQEQLTEEEARRRYPHLVPGRDARA